MKIICKEKILPLIIQHHFASTAYAHSRKPEIFYCQTAFVDGLQAIFQFAEIGIDIVCPKGELDSTLFRFADDVEAWNFVACVDFECNVMFFLIHPGRGRYAHRSSIWHTLHSTLPAGR